MDVVTKDAFMEVFMSHTAGSMEELSFSNAQELNKKLLANLTPSQAPMRHVVSLRPHSTIFCRRTPSHLVGPPPLHLSPSFPPLPSRAGWGELRLKGNFRHFALLSLEGGVRSSST